MCTIRPAVLDDIPTLAEIIAESSRALSRADYSSEQIEAALGSAWGVDTELVRDGTYFVVEEAGGIVACGGWSRRKTLFGADARADRESQLLDPSRDAARIRAFFVRPAWARMGIGRRLLERCEAEAQAHGFRALELMATLPGRRLYEACGYHARQPIQHPLAPGLTIEFVPMRKEISNMTVTRESAVDIYRRLLDAWNRRDADAFAGLFAPDGSAIGFDGSQMNGRDDIRATLRSIFADHETATYVAKIREVRTLGAGVMLVRTVAGLVPRGGTELNPATNAVQSLLVVGDGGSPAIALLQNTPAAFHGRPQLAEALANELKAVIDAGHVVQEESR